MESLLGKILKNQYYISKELEKKNYWTIYLAEDRIASLAPLCVIKRLRTQIESKIFNPQVWNDLREILTLELMKLKQVDHHQQIPEIRDFFVIDRDFYFVRDFIAGETLDEEINRNLLSEGEVINLLQNSLRCLAFMHKKNILHLNLKPSNIIYREEDQRIFLTDFGRLKKLVEENNLQPIFLTNKYFKENKFDAPEQQQDKAVFASDIYALGQIAIYALSGKRNNKVAINNLDHLARSAIKDLKNHQEISISSKLANVLNKMTRDRPQDRYQSAIEVLQALEQEENVVIFPPPFEEEKSSQDEDQLKVSKKNNNDHTHSPQNTQEFSKHNFVSLELLRIIVIPVIVILVIAAIIFNNFNKYRGFVEYNNERYNISLKYPQDWSLEELDDPITGDIAVLSSPSENGFDLFREKIYLSIDELPKEVNSLDIYSQTMLKKIKSQLPPDTVIYQGEIDDLSGYKARSLVYLRQEGTKSLQQMEIFTVKGNRAYVFTYIAEDIKYQEFLKITKKILASLEIKNEIRKKEDNS